MKIDLFRFECLNLLTINVDAHPRQSKSSTATTPELSIEVVFTSGSERKLTRYQALSVPEVWFWEDGVFRLYHLREFGYERIERSEVLPDLDIKELSRCLMMASKVEAVKEFRQAILAGGEGKKV